MNLNDLTNKYVNKLTKQEWALAACGSGALNILLVLVLIF